MNSCYPNHSYYLETASNTTCAALTRTPLEERQPCHSPPKLNAETALPNWIRSQREFWKCWGLPMGPGPFFRVLVKKKNLLCGRNAGDLLPWRYSTQKGVTIRGQMSHKIKIYYSYFIAVIRIKGLCCPCLSEHAKLQWVNIITPLLIISSERWSQAR
jgi:hypothetical protein